MKTTLSDVLNKADELNDYAAVAMSKLDYIKGIPEDQVTEMHLTRESILQDLDDIYFNLRDLIVLADTYGEN